MQQQTELLRQQMEALRKQNETDAIHAEELRRLKSENNLATPSSVPPTLRPDAIAPNEATIASWSTSGLYNGRAWRMFSPKRK